MIALRRALVGLVVIELAMQPFERLDKASFVLLLVIALVHVALSLGGRESPVPRGALTLPLVGLVLVSGLAGVLSTQPVYSTRYGLETFGAPLILYLAVLRLGGLDPTRFHGRWVRIFGLPIVIALAAGVLYGFITLGTRGAASDLRFHGGFYWYAQAARYLEVALFLTLGIGLWWWHRGHRAVAAACLVVLGLAWIALVATKTKGAYLGFAGGAVTVMLLSLPARRIPLAALVLAGAGALTLLVPGVRSEASKFLDLERLGEASSTAPFRYRPHGWRFVIDHAGDRPFVGNGPGGKLFRAALIEEGKTVEALGDEPLIAFYGRERSARTPILDHAHNFVLQAYHEMGVLGLIAFAWLFGAFFRRAWRGIRSLGPPGRVLLVAATGAVVAVLVHGLVAHVYSDTTFLLLIVGMATADGAPVSSGTAPDRSEGSRAMNRSGGG